jgi:hypothetical protein
MRRINDVLVDLVGDDERVVLARQLENEKQFFAGEDFARGIRGIAEYERLWFLREGPAQLVRIETELRRLEPDVDRLRAGEDRIGGVILVEGREDDDLVGSGTVSIPLRQKRIA